MKTDYVQAYRQLNESFRAPLIFRTGIDSGFFAEYTYLINAMLYCLKHHLQFRLHSVGANYTTSKGWTDYFQPFCKEDRAAFHRTFNIHALPPWKTIIARSKQEHTTAYIKWKLKNNIKYVIGKVLALLTYRRWARLNYDVKLNPDEHYLCPELGINEDYVHAFNRMADITFRFNEAVAEACRNTMAGLLLPDHFVSCQIRGGDKTKEAELLLPEYYALRLRKPFAHQLAFVLTDDYRLYVRLQQLCPHIRWVTCCKPDEQGYDHASFEKTDDNKKREQMINLLTSVHICLHSGTFAGSICTGPSMFLLKKHYPHVIPLDCRMEDLHQAYTLPIALRSQMAQEYLKSLDLEDRIREYFHKSSNFVHKMQKSYSQ